MIIEKVKANNNFNNNSNIIKDIKNNRNLIIMYSNNSNISNSSIQWNWITLFSNNSIGNGNSMWFSIKNYWY